MGSNKVPPINISTQSQQLGDIEFNIGERFNCQVRTNHKAYYLYVLYTLLNNYLIAYIVLIFREYIINYLYKYEL